MAQEHDAQRALCPGAAHHHRPHGGAAVGSGVRVHGAALEPGHPAAVRRGGAGHRGADRDLQGLSAGRRPSLLRRIALERLDLIVDFLSETELPPPGPKPFFSLLDQSLSEELGKPDRQAVLDRHGRPLGAGRDPHQARRHGDAHLRPPQRRLCVEFGHLSFVDGGHLAGAAHRRHPVPAQPDPPDPAAGRRRRELRQGARGAELPPARRPRGAPRGGAPSSR